MTDLKTKIARGEYEIDSREVAEAIISKLRTVRRVREQIEAKRVPGLRTGRFDPSVAHVAHDHV